MTLNSIDLTGVPGFKADGPPAMHHRHLAFWEVALHIAIPFFIVGLVVGLPVFTVLRLMGWW